MFDFDDLEDTDPVDESLEDVALAAAAAASLKSEAFTERRDACRRLIQLQTAARPHLAQLLQLSESDEDYEVRKAAKTALRTLRRNGIALEAQTVSEGVVEETKAISRRPQGPVVEVEPIDWMGPKALFDINGQVLNMCLERQVTPQELVEIWESWRLHYTQRIRFLVGQDEDIRCLSRDELLPLIPEVVKLEAAVGSVLLPLAGVLREFGHFPPKEVQKKLEDEVKELHQEAERKKDPSYRPKHRNSTGRPWRELPITQGLNEACLFGREPIRWNPQKMSRKKQRCNV